MIELGRTVSVLITIYSSQPSVLVTQ